jgi:SAM-dependent methyltransferase
VTREQRLVFGEDAALYDRARPGYPDALFDGLVEIAGIAPPARVLEVGAGTGKATVPLAARGFSVLALEPSAEMAALARERIARFGGATVVVTSFEDSEIEVGAFSLVYSATAWHWVRADLRLPRAHEALEPDGVVAMFWHRPEWPGTALRRTIDAVYGEVAPELETRMPGYSSQDVKRRECVEELEASPLFGAVEERRLRQHIDYETEDYLDLLRTQSNHRLLDPGTRVRLFDAIGRAIDDAGGVMPVDYEVQLYVARRI